MAADGDIRCRCQQRGRFRRRTPDVGRARLPRCARDVERATRRRVRRGLAGDRRRRAAAAVSGDLDALRARIGHLDSGAIAAARARQDTLTKPRGALGRLEDLSVWLAGGQGRCPPIAPQRVRVVVFAADHGVAAAGVSAYPQEVTGQMVANFVAGGAAVNVLAAGIGATVRVVDVGVAHPPPDLPVDVTRHRVRSSSGRIDVEDALSTTDVLRAIGIGVALADDEVDAGADLLIPGDMGIANTTPATTLIAALTGSDAEAVVGRGTGVDDATLA